MDSSANKPPKVAVVVLTWNDVEMTAECVASILANDYANFHVILVDNGSKEPCGERLKQRFPAIDMIALPQNRGFTGGSNAGIDWALRLDPKYVHLIGNDSTLAKDAIRKLVDHLEISPEVGGASPLLFNPGEERVVQLCGGSIDRDFAVIKRDDWHGPYEEREWPTRECEFIPFVAMMFRAEALRQVGTLDETFGTCWEDYDLLVRFADAGWKFAIVGDSEAVHKCNQTTGHQSPYIIYNLIRNRLICWRRYGKLSRALRRPIYLLRIFVWWPIKANGWSWERQRAYLRGVRHFFFGVRGEGHAPKSTKSGVEKKLA
ncbi:MAG: glycosyltransferase family 2 protein [Planctomycetota bacterium]|jgi:GT2 family glycosyltransferase